jgi:hypothetical protein
LISLESGAFELPVITTGEPFHVPEFEMIATWQQFYVVNEGRISTLTAFWPLASDGASVLAK